MRSCLSDVRISSDFNAIPLERLISLNTMAAKWQTELRVQTIHTCVQSAHKIHKVWLNWYYVLLKVFRASLKFKLNLLRVVSHLRNHESTTRRDKSYRRYFIAVKISKQKLCRMNVRLIYTYNWYYWNSLRNYFPASYYDCLTTCFPRIVSLLKPTNENGSTVNRDCRATDQQALLLNKRNNDHDNNDNDKNELLSLANDGV